MIVELIAVAAIGAAPPPADAVVGCSEHVESGFGPLPAPGARESVIGPLSFTGLRGAASAPRSQFDGELWKAPATVEAGARVTLVVPEDERAHLRLSYAGREGFAIRFEPCRRTQRAFSYDGVVGARTGWAGGFAVSGARCADVEVWIDGRAQPLRRTISFGRGRCAGTPPAAGRAATAPAAPHIGCSSRIRVARPWPAPPRGVLRMGPLAFSSLSANARAVATLPARGANGFLVATPAVLRARTRATVLVEPADRAWVRLRYANVLGSAVTLVSCSKPPPFPHRGAIGEWTAWPGGFLVKRPGCAHIQVWVYGRAEPLRRALPLGARCP